MINNTSLEWSFHASSADEELDAAGERLDELAVDDAGVSTQDALDALYRLALMAPPEVQADALINHEARPRLLGTLSLQGNAGVSGRA